LEYAEGTPDSSFIIEKKGTRAAHNFYKTPVVLWVKLLPGRLDITLEGAI
jgi:hypothetical protein